MNLVTALRKAMRDPGMACNTATGLLRGYYYRVKFRLLGRRVIIGKFFRVNGPLDINGPGTVIFGDYCSVSSSRLRPTTPYTHSPDAVIRFGNRVLLTRSRLGCVKSIDVADDAGLAECWIMDSDFHSTQATTDGPRYNSPGISKPVIIGRNSWIGAGSMVLKGVRVGENSIVGAGAVVATNVPDNTVVFGNPARVVWRLRKSTSSAAAATTGEEAGR
jgi:acetyltransferase-like isoleucine patch superfamily enzyme